MTPNLVSMADAAVDFTRDVTTRWNSRLAGSPACLACGDHLRKAFSGFCDKTESQEFFVRPDSFLGYIRINIVLFVIAVLDLWLDQMLNVFAPAFTRIRLTG